MIVKECYGSAHRQHKIDLHNNTIETLRISHGSHTTNSFLLRFSNFFHATFLPEGFPHSVGADYVPYQIWDTLQALCSAVTGTLSTRAILGGVGVGNASANVISGTLQWIVRDGTGMLGRIYFASHIASDLDNDMKRWRIAADVTNDIGLCLEIACAMVSRRYFLFLVCLAAIFKAVTAVAGLATRSTMAQHFSRRQNMADISAKNGSQETAVSFIGMFFGMIVATFVPPTILYTSLVFCIVTFLHLFCNFRAVKMLVIHHYNQSRLDIALCYFLLHQQQRNSNDDDDDDDDDDEVSGGHFSSSTSLQQQKVNVTTKASEQQGGSEEIPLVVTDDEKQSSKSLLQSASSSGSTISSLILIRKVLGSSSLSVLLSSITTKSTSKIPPHHVNSIIPTPEEMRHIEGIMWVNPVETFLPKKSSFIVIGASLLDVVQSQEHAIHAAQLIEEAIQWMSSPENILTTTTGDVCDDKKGDNNAASIHDDKIQKQQMLINDEFKNTKEEHGDDERRGREEEELTTIKGYVTLFNMHTKKIFIVLKEKIPAKQILKAYIMAQLTPFPSEATLLLHRPSPACSTAEKRHPTRNLHLLNPTIQTEKTYRKFLEISEQRGWILDKGLFKLKEWRVVL